MRAKLAEAGATGERWTSWKEATGWIVKLEFTANDVDHDARWGFEPRRSTLSPLNPDAIQLSRQGSLPEGLIPRLRALDQTPVKDDSRFDSGAFGPRRLPDPEADLESPDVPVAGRTGRAAGRDQARRRADRDDARDGRPARGAPPPARSARAAARGRADSPRPAAQARSLSSTLSSRATKKRRPPQPSRSPSTTPKRSPVAPRHRVAARAAPRCRRGTRSSSAARGEGLSARRSSGERAETDERDGPLLVGQRSVLADHLLRRLVGQAIVVVGDPACAQRRGRRRSGRAPRRRPGRRARPRSPRRAR